MNRTLTRKIWVTFQKVGLHRYPAAPDEVAYLRDMHRHVFHFKVTIEVEHDNREIEFHMMKNRLLALYDFNTLELNHKSCEMLAQELHDQILNLYDCSDRMVSVEVSEDGECGAEVCSVGRAVRTDLAQQMIDSITPKLTPQAVFPFPDSKAEPGQEES